MVVAELSSRMEIGVCSANCTVPALVRKLNADGERLGSIAKRGEIGVAVRHLATFRSLSSLRFQSRKGQQRVRITPSSTVTKNRGLSVARAMYV